MLTIQRCAKLAGVQVQRMEHGHLGETGLFGHGCGGFSLLRLENGAAQDGRHFDLNALSAAAHLKLCGALTRSPGEQSPRTAQRCLNSGAKSMQCFVDVAQTISTTLDRQLGEIDVHRQPRQVADKEVDRGPALECKAGFPADKRQQLDQQDHLPVERIISAQHRNAPAR